MKKWESKFLPTSKAAILVVAQTAIGTRADKIKIDGASVMVAEAGLATLPAKDQVKKSANGKADQFSSIVIFYLF